MTCTWFHQRFTITHNDECTHQMLSWSTWTRPCTWSASTQRPTPRTCCWTTGAWWGHIVVNVSILLVLIYKPTCVSVYFCGIFWQQQKIFEMCNIKIQLWCMRHCCNHFILMCSFYSAGPVQPRPGPARGCCCISAPDLHFTTIGPAIIPDKPRVNSKVCPGN